MQQADEFYWTADQIKGWSDDRLLDQYWNIGMMLLMADEADSEHARNVVLPGWFKRGRLISAEMRSRGTVLSKKFYPKFDEERYNFVRSVPVPDQEAAYTEWARLHGEEWRMEKYPVKDAA